MKAIYLPVTKYEKYKSHRYWLHDNPYFTYDNILVTPFVTGLDRSRKDFKDAKIYADSGGYQIATQGKRVSAVNVVLPWQENIADIAFTVDVPPHSFGDDFTEYQFMKCMKKSNINADLMWRFKVNDDMQLWGVTQGRTFNELELWYNDLTKEHEFDGYCISLSIHKSGTIGPDGTIYAGADDGYLYAINPNGTIRWEYHIGGYDKIFSPAVDNQGNIYFTTYSTGDLFCLNTNGTLKWRYTKNLLFKCGPVIGDDGMIYVVPSSNLVAVNPDGTVKWDVYMHNWFGHPSLAHDGTIIIAGGGDDYATAVDPVDGSIIWQYRVSNSVNRIKSSDVAIGGDGTMYFAYVYNNDIGYMCALTSDGVLKWENHLTSDKPYSSCYIHSEPCIGSDGTVYINTIFTSGGGYLHAIGMQNPIDAPEAPVIEGETNGRAGSNYEYTLQATSSTGDDVYFFVDWDDYFFEEWFGPYPSGTQVTISHKWQEKGTYTIRVRAKTGDGLCGPWSEFSVNMEARNRVTQRPFFNFLEQHSILYQLLQRFLQL